MDEELVQMVSDMQKKFGGNRIGNGADRHISFLPTGSLGLDEATGGGWPMGRFCVLWGNYSSGKSSLALMTIANAQQRGMKCLYIDAEKTFDTTWAQKHGVNVEDLILARVTTVEDILEVAIPFVSKNLVDVIVIDSINAFNYEKFYDDNNGSIGLHAKAVGEVQSKINNVNENTLVLLISQVRNKFGKNFAFASYSGGNSVDFYPSLNVQLVDTKDLLQTDTKNKYTAYAKYIDWEVKKTKVSMPYQGGRFLLRKEGGIDRVDEAVGLAIKHGLINKSGTWFNYGATKIQGFNNLVEYLKDEVNQEQWEEIYNEVSQRIYGTGG